MTPDDTAALSDATLADALVPRPAVQWFAAEMERQLRENDHKGGWEACDIEWLLKRCDDELRELYRAVMSGKPRAEVVEEAADVANFALMIADNIGPHAMPDHLLVPRAVVDAAKAVVKADDEDSMPKGWLMHSLIAVLRAALATPQPEPRP